MYKVLIADDEPFILEGLRSIINWNELGLEIVDQCSDGLEAVKVLDEKRIDIIITDIKMPEMNGIELIKHIKYRKLNTRCIVLSGYDDFEYVKEAAMLGIENYLLKPISINELISTLQNVIEKIDSEVYRKIEQTQEKNILRNNILYRWMTDDIDNTELSARASLIGIDLGSKSFLASIIKVIFDDQKSSQNNINDKKLLKFAAHNICSELISENLNGTSFNDMYGDIVVLFCEENNRINIPVLKSTLDKCICNINSLLGVDVFITVGSIQKNYKDLHFSYSHAKKMQEFQLVFPYNSILLYDEVSQLFDNHENLPKIDYRRIHNSISLKDRQKTIQFINDIYKQLTYEKKITPSCVRDIALELLFNIKNILNELSPKAERFYYENRDIFQSVYRFDSTEKLIEWLKDIAIKSIEYLEQSEEQISPLIRRVLNYIQDNYASNIDLKLIASKHKINPMYLGQCFKRETGDTFTNYINKIRIDKAKELLQNSSFKANEIALKVGYINVNYFYTIFKKIVGQSPSDFLRK